MYQVVKMKKEEMFKYGEDNQMLYTNSGKYFTWTKQSLFQVRDSTKNLVSTSTDHSTSNQECQCKELLNALELAMLPLRIGERM